MVQINWTYQSVSDLKDISEYIAKDSKIYARLQIVRIKDRTQSYFPKFTLEKIVSEINNVNTRELIEGNYRIIYKIINNSRVDILTIHHSARDLGKRKL